MLPFSKTIRHSGILLLGILLVVGGTAAIIVPLVTVAASLVAVIVLGIVLILTGVGVAIGSVWAGKRSGMLLHLLVGVLYVLDEPSIGLHPRDNARLLTTLKGLRDHIRPVWNLILRQLDALR